MILQLQNHPSVCDSACACAILMCSLSRTALQDGFCSIVCISYWSRVCPFLCCHYASRMLPATVAWIFRRRRHLHHRLSGALRRARSHIPSIAILVASSSHPSGKDLMVADPTHGKSQSSYPCVNERSAGCDQSAEWVHNIRPQKMHAVAILSRWCSFLAWLTYSLDLCLCMAADVLRHNR